MAQECGFFNAQLVGEEYDRVYLAEQFAAYFASFIGNGVYGNSMEELQVIANDDMTTSVLSGQAWTNGWWYRNTDIHTLSHSVADGLLSRIDIVVLRWDNSERDMYLAVIEGTPSANPVAPSIVRNADYYDLQLCSVSIPAGSIRITQAQITDTRLDNSVCGLVTGVVDQIDTSSLFTQFQTAFTEWKENQQADYENWTAEKKEAYDTFVEDAEQDFGDWFEYMKGQLSEDAAGHLQNEIGILTDLMTQEKTNLVGAINELFDNDSTIEEYVKGAVGGDEYSSTHTSESGVSNWYDYGEACIYNNKIYWCKATNGVSASVLPTDTTNWEETSLASLKSSLMTKQDKLTNPLVQADVVNNLTSTAANKPLSANMGKVLNEGKQDKLTNPLTQADVVNNLTSTATNKPLSANMGKTLNGRLTTAETNISNHTTSISSLNTNVNNLKTINNSDVTLVSNCNNAPLGISATTDIASNRPTAVSAYCSLITMRLANNNGFKHQICVCGGGISVYVRRCWNGTWGNWKEIVA